VVKGKLIKGPGSLKPNDFELAILEHLARQEPAIGGAIESLHVLSREFTGAGSFTTFKCDEFAVDAADKHVGLDAEIHMPGVPEGMGAVLFCRGNQPERLEVYTFGDEHWDGTYEGFVLGRTA
jgi:hypothetical protein